MKVVPVKSSAIFAKLAGLAIFVPRHTSYVAVPPADAQFNWKPAGTKFPPVIEKLGRPNDLISMSSM